MLNSRHNGTRIRRERKRERGKEACSCAREREPEYAGTRCHMRSEIFDHVMISTACKGEVEYLIPVSLLPSLSLSLFFIHRAWPINRGFSPHIPINTMRMQDSFLLVFPVSIVGAQSSFIFCVLSKWKMGMRIKIVLD